MKLRKKYLFYTLAFSSAIVAAFVATVDTTISKLYITDPISLGLSCFLIGVPLTILIVAFFSIPLKEKSLGGKIIDPSFDKIRLPYKNELKYHLLAGIGNATLTMGYFLLLTIFPDPSVVLPFSQVVILYLLIIESITEKNVPTLPEIQSSVIITFGAILGSITLTGSLTIEALLIVFLVINPGWVLITIYQKKLKMLKFKNKRNDSLNIRLWNVIFACIVSTLMILLYDIITGSEYLKAAIDASLKYYEWIILTMLLTFFSYVFYIRALGLGKASVTQAVKASIIVFIIPLTLIIANMGIIQGFSTDPVMLIIKMIGVVLILFGIISFALTLVKAYVFIKIKPGYDIEKTMQKVWNIRGVNRVAATSGQYDLVAKIHIRTMVKGYEKIIKRIQEIEGIQSYKWQSVLKEWEDI